MQRADHLVGRLGYQMLKLPAHRKAGARPPQHAIHHGKTRDCDEGTGNAIERTQKYVLWGVDADDSDDGE